MISCQVGSSLTILVWGVQILGITHQQGHALYMPANTCLMNSCPPYLRPLQGVHSCLNNNLSKWTSNEMVLKYKLQ